MVASKIIKFGNQNTNSESIVSSSENTKPSSANQSRRKFLGTTTKIAAAGVAAGVVSGGELSLARSAFAGGSDSMKIGLVGCGGRGSGAANNALNTKSGNVQLAGVADVFEDRMNSMLKGVTKKHGEKVQVKDATKFIGFDAYEKLLDTDIDLVILATPPGFRPLHFEKAIEAGKHVFMEKPVAVDIPGVRRVLAASEMAREKNLAVGVGLQRRHETKYRETIQALKEGIIGDLIYSRVYWNGPGVWLKARKPGQSELDYQMRNWYYFNWLCGDHIVEQHIHNLDVINWLLDDFPVSAQGQGGRLIRNYKDTGHIFDHHAVEYTFKNGHKMMSQCRHMPECWNHVDEWVHGAKGYAHISKGRIFNSDGKLILHSKKPQGESNGWQEEHHHLFADISNGARPNEGEYGAMSTMTAIVGRLATYTGKMLKMEAAMKSNVSLADVDNIRSFDDEAPIQPNADGNYRVASPGTKYKEIIDWDA